MCCVYACVCVCARACARAQVGVGVFSRSMKLQSAVAFDSTHTLSMRPVLSQVSRSGLLTSGPSNLWGPWRVCVCVSLLKSMCMSVFD